MTRANKIQSASSEKVIAHVTKPRIAKKTKQTSKTAPKLERARINDVPAERQRKTIVMGHRGGNFGPDNSMKNFRGSVENKLEGIEFDVSAAYHAIQILTTYFLQIWISKDNVPMVLHGGNDGQLCKYGLPDEHVFDWTMDELR